MDVKKLRKKIKKHKRKIKKLRLKIHEELNKEHKSYVSAISLLDMKDIGDVVKRYENSPY